MYRGFHEAWAGFAKNAHEGMATPLGLPVWTVLLLGGHVLPFALLPFAARPHPRPGGSALPRAPVLSSPLRRGRTPGRSRCILSPSWSGWRSNGACSCGSAAARRAGLEGQALSGGVMGMQGRAARDGRQPRDENFPVASLLLAPRASGRGAGLLPLRAQGGRHRRCAGSRTVLEEDSRARRPRGGPAGRGDPADPGGGAASRDADPLRRRPGARPATSCAPSGRTREAAATRTGTSCSTIAASRRIRSAASSSRCTARAPGCAWPCGRPLRRAADPRTICRIAGPTASALDRVYCPVAWMAEAGRGDGILRAVERRPAPRACSMPMLDRVDDLIECAEGLPERLSDRRLRAQSRRDDRLARAPVPAPARRTIRVTGRVQVGRGDVLRAFVGGLRGLAPVSGRDRVVTRAARASLGLLVPSRHDEPARGAPRAASTRSTRSAARRTTSRTARRLPPRSGASWTAGGARSSSPLGAPRTPIGRELARAAAAVRPASRRVPCAPRRHGDRQRRHRCGWRTMPPSRSTDAASRARSGSCRSASSAAPRPSISPLSLGRTLQLVNILRDVDEDAAVDRVYVPLARLAGLGLQDAPAPVLVADPRFARVCRDLAGEARAGFSAADAALEEPRPRPPSSPPS